ncbi:MAG TPA: hypothetical protein VFL27_11170 [Candidatus Dormibacteraeota bacterium]|nr:hypothetical protein [Candidatus Dormibacteraeota bacterium]
MAQNTPDASQLAKRFIDTSLEGRAKQPSKAAYARALKIARQAMADLLQLRDASARGK